MQDLRSFCETQFPRTKFSRSTVHNLRTALRHLERLLERTPLVSDLNGKTITVLLVRLEDAGKRPETVRRVRTSLMAVGRAAVTAGLIDPLQLPTIDLQRRQSFTLPELDRLFGAARTMPGDVAGVAASEFWTALLLCVFDAGIPAPLAIALPATAFNARRGTLDTGSHVRDLHPLTINALTRLRRTAGGNLLPFDRALSILYGRMKWLLWRGGLSFVSRNMFERLRYTGRRCRSLIDEIDMQSPFTPKPGRPKVLRIRDRRRALLRNVPRPPADGIYRLSIDSPRTLRRFFEDVYLQRRMSDAVASSASDYRTAIESLSGFLGCDATVDVLGDELLTDWLLALKRGRQLGNATLNSGYRAPLLALWRAAWRARLVNDEPRDVIRFKVPRRLPEAWTTEEVSRILQAAATVPGTVSGIPAAAWWTAFLLCMYDSGVRVGALLRLPVAQVDLADGWIRIPAELQKHGAEQAFELHPDTVAAIKATKPQGRTVLFPCPWTSGRLCKQYRDILEAAGLPATSRDLFHRLRRTSCTAVAKAIGVAAAQEHLGHSSASLTKQAYLDPRLTGRNESAALLIERPRLAKSKSKKGGRS